MMRLVGLSFRTPTRARALLQQHAAAAQRHLSAKTYYDSQSGMHVPIHNENDIYIYKHWKNPYNQLYKSADDALDVKEELDGLAKVYDGVILSSPMAHPRDERNLTTILNLVAPICGDGFIVFAPPSKSNNDVTTKESNDIVVLCEYNDTTITDRLKQYKKSMIQDPLLLDGGDAIEMANQIANLIDKSGGGDYVHVLDQQDDDDTLQLCEELSYLDVPGPTMKSRLVLDCDAETTEDLVDNVMMMGVNKFSIWNDEQRDLIQSVANEQGKQLVKS